MAHAREQIRGLVVAAVTGLGVTGPRVRDTPFYPMEEEFLPGLAVSTPREDKIDESQTIGGREDWRLVVLVEARARPPDGGPSAQSQADTIAAQVQAALMADFTLGGKVRALELDRTTLEYSGAGQRPLARLLLEYHVRYSIDRKFPEVLIYG